MAFSQPWSLDVGTIGTNILYSLYCMLAELLDDCKIKWNVRYNVNDSDDAFRCIYNVAAYPFHVIEL